MDIADVILHEGYRTEEEIAVELKEMLTKEIGKLKRLSTPRLLASRYEKFRKIGN